MLAVVGFGSNVGDRLAALRDAAEQLGRVAILERGSHVYETAPVGPPQRDFLNAAALVRATLDPVGVLDALLAIEQRLGRVRRERWGPRVIDLDVLWIEGVAFDDERLTVPHPRLAERAFALAPLLEVYPGARDPRTGAPYAVPPGALRRTNDLLIYPRVERFGV